MACSNTAMTLGYAGLVFDPVSNHDVMGAGWVRLRVFTLSVSKHQRLKLTQTCIPIAVQASNTSVWASTGKHTQALVLPKKS